MASALQLYTLRNPAYNVAAWLNRFIAKFLGKNSFTFTRASKEEELIDMNEERNQLADTAVVDVAPVTSVAEQPNKPKMAAITNEIFSTLKIKR